MKHATERRKILRKFFSESLKVEYHVKDQSAGVNVEWTNTYQCHALVTSLGTGTA
jgi:hypothetical protein